MINALTASKLYECRDTARCLLGKRYPEKMAEYGKAITEAANRLNCHALVAAARMVETTDNGVLKTLIFAAAVEIVEPTGS